MTSDCANKENKENVIGIVFNTHEDEKIFFYQFKNDGSDENISGRTLILKGENGNDDEPLLTAYFFESKYCKNNVNAFITDKHVQFALDYGWIKYAVWQGERNVKDKKFLREFVNALYDKV